MIAFYVRRSDRPRRAPRPAALPVAALGALLACLALPAAGAPDPPITFTRDVAPILQANCQTCHRPGGIAPFSLLTYDDAKSMAEAIQYFTGQRIMPPWKAADGYGEFQDSRRLTDAQIQTLSDWVDAGTPEGDPKDLPPQRAFLDGWTLGTPDVVLELGETFTVPAQGGDVFRAFVLPFHPRHDFWLAALEVLPGDRQTAHHALIYLDPAGKSPALDAASPGPGFSPGVLFSPRVLLDAWVSGSVPHLLPAGTAFQIPAHSYVVIDMHYRTNGVAHQDHTRLGLYFAHGPIDKRVRMGVVGTENFAIPANNPAYTVHANSGPLPRDITVHSVFPHMHRVGKEMKATATLPGGIARPLIWVRDWDDHWQLSYAFKEPRKLPATSRIDIQAIYDNSSDNPHNPNYPPIPVKFGGLSTDEMCFFYLRYTVDDEHLLQDQRIDEDGLEIKN